MVFQQYPVIEELEEVEEDDIFETQVQIFFVNVKGLHKDWVFYGSSSNNF